MTDRTRAALPSLAPLYAKAVVTGPRRSGESSLRELSLSVPDQRIDREHLARYQRLCGYPVSDQLPPTYLHLLSFGLSVARMTEPDFPFALLGLVHVNNTVELRRPVYAGEQVSVRAWAAGVREHPAGRQVDLLSEATVGGEVVWRECSTYLRRGRNSPPAQKPGPQSEGSPKTPGDRARAGGPEPAGLSVPARWQVPAGIGRAYAAVSGDRNPIHLYPLTARAFGFPRAIAHGMWVLARTLSTVQNRLPQVYTVDAAFKTPVLLPSTVELEADRSEDGWSLQLRSARTGKPHLTVSIRG
jgi:acyl dehydratase